MKIIILFVIVSLSGSYLSYQYGLTIGRIEVAKGDQICKSDFNNKYYCEPFSFGIIDGESPYYK